jgi:flagellar hook protein FlgE
VDSNGYLVANGGQRVQGYSDAGLSTVGDIKIDNTGAPSGDTSAVQSYTIGSDGKISVLLADGTQFTRGQILLQNVADPSQLVKVGDNLYSGLTAAGATTTPLAPNSSNMGSLVTGSLEMSNVDLATQLTDLITVQSAYQASSKVITTSDNVLQTLINLVR